MPYKTHGIICNEHADTSIATIERRSTHEGRTIRLSISSATPSFHAAATFNIEDAKRLRDALTCAINYEERNQ